MEDVYVIRVKTQPVLSSLYPSERRYSASTVGGLSFIHFVLGILALLLSIFCQTLQGLILFASCLVPSTLGILAWRRWYVDRNITIFFYGCLFSLIVSILCTAASVLDITMFAKENMFLTTSFNNFSSFNMTSTLKSILSPEIENSTISDNVDHHDETGIFDNGTENEQDSKRFSVILLPLGEVTDTNKTLKNFPEDEYDEAHMQTRFFFMLNVLIASFLEILWSLLSAKIALQGMKNKSSEINNSCVVKDVNEKQIQSRIKSTSSPPALRSKSDIILHNKHICCSIQSLDSLQSVYNLHNLGPRLPMPESSREFRERVENFLADQVTGQVSEAT